MWFRQLQIFSLTASLERDSSAIESQLESFAFSACLPHLFSSMGWVPPIGDLDDEFASWTHSVTDFHLICCQFEEKILPTTVVQQKVTEKIKAMTAGKEKKTIPLKEKQHLKETIEHSLLPQAFTKLTRVYAYIDNRNKQLLINTTNKYKTEQLMALFQRTFEQKILPLEHKKISPILTKWLTRKKAPKAFYIEKSCLLQDPQQQHRLIRCQEQDLFSDSIQSLLQERCDVKQLALSFQDQVHFILTDDFILKSVHFDDAVIEAAKEAEYETEDMQFQADFIMMTHVLTELVAQLINAFCQKSSVATPSSSQSKLEVV